MNIPVAIAAVTASLAFTTAACADQLADATAPPSAAAVCAACHGAQGEGAASGVPRLAEQNADYIRHALATFKTGARPSSVMQPIAQNLDDATIDRLAGFFSRQHAPLADRSAAPSPQLVRAGQRLAETGADNAPACFTCHAAQGDGNGARFPRVAGQPAQYVINRLHEFQARARGKAVEPATMTAVAATLGERQIEELSAYLSQLER